MEMLAMVAVEERLRACVSQAGSRLDLWVEFINSMNIQRMAEIGVYRGDFAQGIMKACECLTAYYMIDPWRHLEDWNKPANHDHAVLEQYFHETMAKTNFAGTKRIVLRGKTTEVAEKLADGELDFVYIDGDHTLKGIAIDLVRLYPKVRTGGFVGGDDFNSSIWKHKTEFEPTLVFPFAVYFAEAVGARIYALPYSQFCLQKASEPRFEFVDLTGYYGDLNLRDQVTLAKLVKVKMWERFPGIMSLVRKTRDVLFRKNRSK
jgi:hypothetical protein